VSNLVVRYNKTYINKGVYNISAFDESAFPHYGINGMDLTTDASELLTAAQTKVVSEYGIPANTAGNPAFTAEGKRCSSVITLYDNSKIVGCSNAKDGFCAYQVSEQGKIVKSGVHHSSLPAHLPITMQWERSSWQWTWTVPPSS